MLMWMKKILLQGLQNGDFLNVVGGLFYNPAIFTLSLTGLFMSHRSSKIKNRSTLHILTH